MTDRQTRDRQKMGKISQSCSRRFRRAVEENLVRRDGRTAGDRFQLRAVLRVAISAQSVVSRVTDIFPEFFGHSGSSKKDLGSIAVQNHAMPHPRWSVVIEPPKGG